MKTIYVYKNELLGDNGDQFNDQSLIDEIEGETDDECDKKFNDEYGINDYSYSYSKHAN